MPAGAIEKTSNNEERNVDEESVLETQLLKILIK